METLPYTDKTVGIDYFGDIKNEHEHKLTMQYVAGYLDGDGTITIRRETGGRSSGFSGTIIVDADQCDPSVTLLLLNKFGGRYECKTQKKENARHQHRWVLTGEKTVPFLKDILPHLILKKKRAELALEFWDKKNEPSTLDEDFLKIFEKNTAMQKMDQLAFESSNIDRLTDSYVAGLFDAEGCVNVCPGNYALTIAQKMKKEILHALKNKYNLGRISYNCWVVGTREESLTFARIIQPLSVVKHRQLSLAMNIFENSIEDRHSRDYDEIRNLKHIQYSFDGQLISRINEMMDNNSIQQRKCTLTNARRNQMSEKKKGENNYLYGKERTGDDKESISRGLLAKSRPSSLIEQIVKDVDSGMDYTAVGEKYGKSRNTVSNIYKTAKNGAKPGTKKAQIEANRTDEFSQQLRERGYTDKGIAIVKSALAKRKWSIPVYVNLKRYIRDNPQYRNKYKYLSDNSEQLFGIKMTVDIVKGIVLGTTKVYEFEVRELSEPDKEIIGEVILAS